jgi:segregation and condensation protein B
VKAEQIVEAILFASDAPLRAEEIARADESLDEDAVEEAIQLLQQGYLEGERAFDIVELAEGYQILTRPEYAPYLERFDTIPKPSRLSGPALETLAIIAYRQPLGRLEMEYVRGVSSSGVIRTLQDRGLIEVTGRGEGIGRPLLYATTNRFLEHFGFRSLDDLPRPEELPVVLRDRSLKILPDAEASATEGEVAAASAGSDEQLALDEPVASVEGFAWVEVETPAGEGERAKDGESQPPLSIS